MKSLGIDVSASRGLDLVLLDGSSRPKAARHRVRIDELPEVLTDLAPDVVAIDSPPAWGTAGGSRACERELRRLGIHSYGTPAAGRRDDHPFYLWMRAGFRVFEAAAKVGYPRYAKGGVTHTALEVFPHGTAVVLAGCLPRPQVAKRTWRAAMLAGQGIDTASLRSPDQIDAALAALTGLLALRGQFTAVGDAEEGVIVLPARSLPTSPFPRCTRRSEPAPQLRLPGLAPCACGDPKCDKTTSAEFAPGHDAKRKSMLWAQARRGEDAIQELRRRNWKLPPDLRSRLRD